MPAAQTPARQVIAVAGATGRIGRHVAELLAAQSYQVVAISRSSGVDLLTGKGLDAALLGVDGIIDVATGASADEAEATEFFRASARHLQQSGVRAGVKRIVMVSIIGCDRFLTGYNAAKRRHEIALLAGPLPVRVLRSSPFHEFVPQVMDWNRQGDLCLVPEMRVQLVAARTVAAALIDLAIQPEWVEAPSGGNTPISEIAGPQPEDLLDRVRLFAARRGDPLRTELDLNDPDRELNRTGALLPGPDAIKAGPTFEEWLDALAPGTTF